LLRKREATLGFLHAHHEDLKNAIELAGPNLFEMALVTGERRAATVRSIDETVIYEISRQQYEPLLRAYPEWLDELAAVMDERLARRMARLAALDAPRRSRSLRRRIRRAWSG
jgi:CRP-like cAMP-binding protein